MSNNTELTQEQKEYAQIATEHFQDARLDYSLAKHAFENGNYSEVQTRYEWAMTSIREAETAAKKAGIDTSNYQELKTEFEKLKR